MSENIHTNCKSLRGYLSDYIDGTLDEGLCAELEQHIEECQDCHIVVDTLRKTITLYHTTAKEEPGLPEQTRERLFRTLNLDDYVKDRKHD